MRSIHHSSLPPHFWLCLKLVVVDRRRQRQRVRHNLASRVSLVCIPPAPILGRFDGVTDRLQKNLALGQGSSATSTRGLRAMARLLAAVGTRPRERSYSAARSAADHAWPARGRLTNAERLEFPRFFSEAKTSPRPHRGGEIKHAAPDICSQERRPAGLSRQVSTGPVTSFIPRLKHAAVARATVRAQAASGRPAEPPYRCGYARGGALVSAA